jgi:hypothetical protein
MDKQEAYDPQRTEGRTERPQASRVPSPIRITWHMAKTTYVYILTSNHMQIVI